VKDHSADKSAREDENFASPEWHEEELEKIEADFAAGRAEQIDWQEAKKQLRGRFEGRF